MRSKLILISAAIALFADGQAFAGQAPPPPSTNTLWILDTTDGGCGLSTTPDERLRLGEDFKIRTGSDSAGTVTQREGFWSVSLPSGQEIEGFRVRGSGTYLSSCSPGDWQGPIRVPPRAPGSPADDSFTVRWAIGAAPAAWRYSIQYRIGQGSWRAWRTSTALKAAEFNGSGDRVYFFRARTIRSGMATDWSPPRRVNT
jgi:hypothetical protein